MFKKTVYSLLLLALAALVNAGELPKKWQASKKAEVLQTDGVITVNSPGSLGGIIGKVTGIANKRYVISFMIKGNGLVQAGINGSTGWAYSGRIKLNDEYQEIKISYFDTASSFSFSVYSQIGNASTFMIKDLKIAPLEVPQLAAADIAGKIFLPTDYPGQNGKIYTKKDAVNYKAVWGKRWYNVMKLPVPVNSNMLYYYAHLQKNSDQTVSVNLRSDSQIVCTGKLAGTANQWQWVKIGPVKAQSIYPEFQINYNTDAKTVIWLDKVVLSTNGSLTDEELNKVEL